jgi:hypothetical protein
LGEGRSPLAVATEKASPSSLSLVYELPDLESFEKPPLFGRHGEQTQDRTRNQSLSVNEVKIRAGSYPRSDQPTVLFSRAALPQFKEPFSTSVDLIAKRAPASPTGNDALDEVSLVGLDGGNPLGRAEFNWSILSSFLV